MTVVHIVWLPLFSSIRHMTLSLIKSFVVLESTGGLIITELPRAIQSVCGNRRRLRDSFLCDWLSHQSFQAGALSKELRGCSGHFHLTGPTSHCHLWLTFPNPPFSSLILFSFPRTLPSAFLFSFSLLCIDHFQSFSGLGHGWGPGQSLDSPCLPVQLQCSSPCSFYRSWSFWFSCPSPTCLGTILCARPRLAAHLPGPG